MNIVKRLLLTIIILSVLVVMACAKPLNRHEALKHADFASLASTDERWDLVRREWAKAVLDADLGNLEPDQRAVFYYEYGRSLGITCYWSLAEQYLVKAYELDAEIGGPAYLSLIELFRLNLDQKKYKEATVYFKKALPELEKLNAPTESPEEFSKLLTEYSIALEGIGYIEEGKRVKDRAMSVGKSARQSITERTPYGSHCQK